MAVAYDDVSTGNTGGLDSTSLQIAAPAGLAAGDLMYALINVNVPNGLAAPSGWTLVEESGHSSAGISGGVLLYRKVATAADLGATFTWTKSLAQKWHGAIVSFTGASPVTPEIDVVVNTNGGTAGTAASTGTIATAISGLLTADFYGALSDVSGVPTFTAGSGSERADAGDSSRGGLQIVTGATSAPGTAGTSTISTASAWSSIRVAIGPRFWETPNAPNLVTPVGGVSIVRSEDLTLEHVHSHPDSGDTQSAAEHRYRLVGAPSWTTVALVGADDDSVIAGGTLAAGGYEWQARSASSLGTYGPWSASAFFTAVDEPVLTITTPADDATVGAEETVNFTLTGTATLIEWRRVADSGGSPDAGTVYDSDSIVGNVRTFGIAFDVTGRDEHLQIRATVDGVTSDFDDASHLVHVAFTPPATPTVSFEVGAASITVNIDNETAPTSDAAASWVGTVDDQTGNGHDLVLPGGSNDPTFLAHAGDNYVFLTGVNGNRLSVPNEAALNIAGDIELIIDCALYDWGSATIQTLIAKRVGELSYWAVIASGVIEFSWSADGSSPAGGHSSTDAAPILALASMERKLLKITHVVDNGAAGNDTKFWMADSLAGPWTQIGSTVTGGGVTSHFAGNSLVEVGAINAGVTLAGKVYEAIIKNGIDGTTVLDIDTSAATAAATTFVADTGQTVTIARSSTGRKAAVVDRDLFLLGTDDYLNLADTADFDFAAAEPFTFLAAVRVHGTPTGTIAAKKAGTASSDVGWMLELNAGTPRARIADGSNAVAASAAGALTAGTVQVIAVRRSITGDALTVFIDGVAGTPVTDSTTATLANAEAFRVGRLSGAGTSYGDFEWVAGALIRQALTDAEIAAVTAAVLAGDFVPPAALNNIWRRQVGDVDEGLRVAKELDRDSSWTDWTNASGTAYEYRAEAVAENGTATFGAWTA